MAKSKYAQAGVNIDENDLANEIIKNIVKETFNQNVTSELEGLFSNGYKLDRSKGNLIGQKLVSIYFNSDLERSIQKTLEGIYKDSGEPLFLTDYVAFGKLKATNAARIVLRIMEASRKGDGQFIPLIGGETAEMPGVIRKGSSEIVVAITYQTKKDSENLIDISHFQGDILTTSIDSVGTKTKLGLDLGLVDGLFYDMIGHSIGDTVVQSAKPLGIAMYLGHSPYFREDMNENYFKSIETAALTNLGYLPHRRTVYCKGQIDIVGSILGIVHRNDLLTGKNIKEGDYLIGWKCFGVNTNGYSLIRKLGDEGKIDYNEIILEPIFTVGEALMLPHDDYRLAMDNAWSRFDWHLKGVAHITGGGIEGNTKRLLPKDLQISIDSLPHSPIFNYIQEHGKISDKEMRRVYNMGVGLVFIVDKGFDIDSLAKDYYHVIGKVVKK